mmetsp:Transcript_18359/g.13226  ORF Transcript_18359/g.13226 Transcript_18359/m.13226 type:complete len:84 (+) Transcript_18359:1779-2030(+)
MLCLFGYMDLLIILKWTTDWTGNEKNSPSIVANMIGMTLGGGAVIGDPILSSKSYQSHVSMLLLLIAFISVPWMLLVKPLVLK